MNKINEIKRHFDSSHSKNKIVISKNEIPNIQFLDVGKELSLRINSILSESKVGIKSFLILDELLSSSIVHEDSIGGYLSIKNLGILLEPDIKIDLVQILDKYSSLHTLFVKWEGEIEDGILYFLTKEKGQKIDIKNLSHIVI